MSHPAVIDQYVAAFALWIEFAGGLVIGFGCVRALVSLIWNFTKPGMPHRSQLILADAVLAGLGFKVAATLLKTIELRSWAEIGAFAAVLAMRTLLKAVLQRERH